MEELKVAELGIREMMRQVIFSVQNLALAQESFDRLNERVTINQGRERSGDLAEVELNRSRVAATQAQPSGRSEGNPRQ